MLHAQAVHGEQPIADLGAEGVQRARFGERDDRRRRLHEGHGEADLRREPGPELDLEDASALSKLNRWRLLKLIKIK